MMYEQLSFLNNSAEKPLAEKMRPNSLDDFIGQEDIIGENSVLRKEILQDRLHSMILWGPPGCGKTTLVHIISNMTHAELYKLSAISAGVKEIKEVLKTGFQNHQEGITTILFIDEIHRLNKAQQDVLLADVEQGNVILIGATTENPSFEINRALLSRTRVIVFHSLTESDICTLLHRAIEKEKITLNLDKKCLMLLSSLAGGDARAALNNLDTLVHYYNNNQYSQVITPEQIHTILSKNTMVYDKNRDEHYQIISALHKSMRNSDPDAAVYWLARMLEAGEDPLFIARRLIRFASEDIGLACNQALQTAIATYQAVHFIGMPECTTALTQTVIYFSVLPKSNSLYKAYEMAKEEAQKTNNIPVPIHLRNASTNLMIQLGYGTGYQYAHDFENKITNMICLPEQIQDKIFYEPTVSGNEHAIKERLQQIKEIKRNYCKPEKKTE